MLGENMVTQCADRLLQKLIAVINLPAGAISVQMPACKGNLKYIFSLFQY
jgi:hypothetical protein